MKSESITSGPSSSGAKEPKQPLSELWKNICPKEKHINISLIIKSILLVVVLLLIVVVLIIMVVVLPLIVVVLLIIHSSRTTIKYPIILISDYFRVTLDHSNI